MDNFDKGMEETIDNINAIVEDYNKYKIKRLIISIGISFISLFIIIRLFKLMKGR